MESEIERLERQRDEQLALVEKQRKQIELLETMRQSSMDSHEATKLDHGLFFHPFVVNLYRSCQFACWTRGATRFLTFFGCSASYKQHAVLVCSI